MSLNIPLGNNYFLKSETNNFILAKNMGGNRDSETYFYQTIEGAIGFLCP